MVGVAEISAGLSSLKIALDITKGLIGISNAVERNSKILDLQRALSDAYVGTIEAHERHAAAVQRIAELEAQIAGVKTWESEKQRYQLHNVWGGATVYALKRDMASEEPAHWLCPQCYQGGKKSILQRSMDDYYMCPGCGAVIETGYAPELV